MRLLPVSHRDVQGTLHRLRPRIAEMAWRAADSRRPLESFHPLQEISAMRHEAAAVRMFAS
jgi:urease accessory protein UreF